MKKAKCDIEKNTIHRNEAQAQKNNAEERLAPHMNLAKVDTIVDLETAIKDSQHLHHLNSDIEDIENTILKCGDCLSMGELEDEVAKEDLATIKVRLDKVKEQSDAAKEKSGKYLLQVRDAEVERDKVHGQADAAEAEAKRQEALARMVEVTERFIKIQIGVRLLQWSIERYREEKRGPLLERASKIFSTLTRGSFKTLKIDFDGNTSQLMGQRPNGKHVDFDGLSTGTGDQLFLSLRFAAVEMQLQYAQSLPFIADDLFVNYSDNRATQGFKVLSDLATKSQVIYFTHHHHLVDVARKVIGEKLSVIQL